ncbi:hypothetical protein FQA47_024500 [Oryzias melastigma]|uniref:Uncharacterized protein n=1 Tax=Oryzias melastigma TaxID=30732 RepID=A0A834BSE0_ORYME|nr:hypothetical protein FQA47_024500 [Oryzias melastigma]
MEEEDGRSPRLSPFQPPSAASPALSFVSSEEEDAIARAVSLLTEACEFIVRCG